MSVQREFQTQARSSQNNRTDVRAPSGHSDRPRQPARGLVDSPPVVSTAVLTGMSEIDALRRQWRDLLSVIPGHSLFMTWEWLAPWYRAHADAGQIHCVTVCEGEQLIGLAPLYIGGQADPYLSSGELGFASTSGHAWGWGLDVLAAPGREGLVARSLINHLHDHRHEWLNARLMRMNPDSRLLAPLVRAATEADIPVIVRPDLKMIAGALSAGDGSFASWVPSKSRRKQNRRALRRLEQDFSSVTLEQCRDREDFDRLLRLIMTLNLQQRHGTAEPSNFEDPRFVACFLESSHHQREAGWLRVSILSCDGQPVALSTDSLYGDCLYGLQPALDPSYLPYDVGHVQMTMLVEQAMADGARRLDLLPGGDYKTQYVAEGAPLLTLALPGRSLRGTWPAVGRLLGRACRGSIRGLLKRCWPSLHARRWPSEVEPGSLTLRAAARIMLMVAGVAEW